MPVIKSAKKKLRQDKKRQSRNKVVKDALKKVVKEFKKSPSEKALQAVYKVADKSVKKNLIHKNKAARLKSSLAKTLAPKREKAATPKTHSASSVQAEKTAKKAPALAKGQSSSGRKKTTKTAKK